MLVQLSRVQDRVIQRIKLSELGIHVRCNQDLNLMATAGDFSLFFLRLFKVIVGSRCERLFRTTY